MKSVWVIVSLLGVVLCASGCAGYVSGDLRNVPSRPQLSPCRGSDTDYQIEIDSDAKADERSQNISEILSTYTLGIVPTYWTSIIHSEATILRDGKIVFSTSYVSRVHKFYGILWPLILPTKTVNSIPCDEGSGIEVAWAIRDRTAAKAIADFGGKTNCYCLLEEPSAKP